MTLNPCQHVQTNKVKASVFFSEASKYSLEKHTDVYLCFKTLRLDRQVNYRASLFRLVNVLNKFPLVALEW